MQVFSRFKLCLIICVMILALAGCSSEDVNPDSGNQDDTTVSVNTEKDENEQKIVGSIGDSEYIYKVKFYSIDTENKALVDGVAAVSSKSEIVPMQALELVRASLEDNSVLISFKDAYIEDGICTINFDSSIKAVSSSDVELEELILDASAQTILDNFSECIGVKVLIDGQAYSTDGFNFDKDYIYMDD